MKNIRKLIRHLFYILVLIYPGIQACSYKQSKDCKSVIGELLFSNILIDWGTIKLGEDYNYIIKIFNPNKNDIIVSIYRKPECSNISEMKNRLWVLAEDNHILKGESYDSLLINFSPRDSSLIGYYSKGIFLKINGCLYMTPITMKACILENFGMLTLKEKQNIPFIEFEKDTVNFDTIYSNEDVAIPIILTNKGTKALIIHKIETTCGCIAALSDQNVIFPGKSATLNISFQTLGKIGFQHKTISLFCNDPVRPLVNFIVKSYVME